MKFIATAILIGFAAITLFGVFGMQHESHYGASCIAVAVNGANVPCPQENVLGFISFHASALQAFAAPVASVISMILLAFLASLLLFVFFELLVSQATPSLAPVGISQSNPRVSRHVGQALAWFALLEKRDPAHN